MIRRRDGEGWALVRQTDHAALAADLAAFGAVAPLGPEEAFALAVRHHDDGWVDRDIAIAVGPDGGPETFLDLPLAEHLAIARRSVARATSFDPYAGILVARYSAWLHGGRAVDDDAVADERDRTVAAWTELARALAVDGVDPAAVEHDLALLGLLDRIALWLCGWPATTELEVEIPSGGSLVLVGEGDRVRIGSGLLREPTTLTVPEQTTGPDAPYEVRARRTRTITVVVDDA